jgi:hypothetical protein
VSAPVLPNVQAPIAAVLMDPATGALYSQNGTGSLRVPVPNIAAPTAIVPADPSTGLTYHL